VLIVLFFAKMLTKIVAVFPAVRFHKYEGAAGVYYTLMMSTGLTFGTISALFGLNHKIISQAQYSYVVGTVIASAVIPTVVANIFFLPRHLLPKKEKAHWRRYSCSQRSQEQARRALWHAEQNKSLKPSLSHTMAPLRRRELQTLPFPSPKRCKAGC
jgi:hypothetical protein